MAPELLKKCLDVGGDLTFVGGSPKGDIFSFGIIMYQVLFRMEPYENDDDIQSGGKQWRSQRGGPGATAVGPRPQTLGRLRRKNV